MIVFGFPFPGDHEEDFVRGLQAPGREFSLYLHIALLLPSQVLLLQLRWTDPNIEEHRHSRVVELYPRGVSSSPHLVVDHLLQ